MDSISEEEVSVAVKQLKNRKAAGVDNIQPELLKFASSVIPHLTRCATWCGNMSHSSRLEKTESSSLFQRKDT